ncbi:TIGR04561 family membrane protein [Spiroplasma endosymbiont of Crioceris asparagi]|uniref:TIGR04561 family membrane protein n=1 Tax=Spiroplasma endosymbiont of Crioceris asparagi TaxID=3066286 RepID=UPI0030D5342A
MLLAKNFIIMDFTISTWVFLLIFMIVAFSALIFYFVFLFKTQKSIMFDKQEINIKDFKRLEEFNNKRNDLEKEISKVKKIIAN